MGGGSGFPTRLVSSIFGTSLIHHSGPIAHIFLCAENVRIGHNCASAQGTLPQTTGQIGFFRLGYAFNRRNQFL